MFFYEIFDEHLKTEKINYKIQYIETIESTNEYAWNLITKNIKNATVVITKNQTNGKGQRENKWFSAPNKSLTFSIIMKVNKKYDELLSLKTGISVIDGIKKNTSIDCHFLKFIIAPQIFSGKLTYVGIRQFRHIFLMYEFLNSYIA